MWVNEATNDQTGVIKNNENTPLDLRINLT